MRMSTTAPNSLKILCIHGYTSNGTIHAYQSRKITSLLSNPPTSSTSSSPTTTTQSYTFLFPSGPHVVPVSHIQDRQWHSYVSKHSPSAGHHAWWFAREGPPSDGPITERSFVDPHTGGYYGLEESLKFLADLIEREGPIHAVWGFSQGACMAGMLVALLASPFPTSSTSNSNSSPSSCSDSSSPSAPAASSSSATKPASAEVESNSLKRELRALLPQNQPPIPGIFFSGFKARFQRYAGIYERETADGDGGEDKAWPPTLHIMGENDDDVRVERSRILLETCGGWKEGVEGVAEMLVHDNGHNLPKEEEEIQRVVKWVRKWVK